MGETVVSVSILSMCQSSISGVAAEVKDSLDVYVLRTRVKTLQNVEPDGSGAVSEIDAIGVRRRIITMLLRLQPLALGWNEPAPSPRIPRNPLAPWFTHELTSRTSDLGASYLAQCPETGQYLLVTTTAHVWHPERLGYSVAGGVVYYGPLEHNGVPALLVPSTGLIPPDEVTKLQHAGAGSSRECTLYLAVTGWW